MLPIPDTESARPARNTRAKTIPMQLFRQLLARRVTAHKTTNGGVMQSGYGQRLSTISILLAVALVLPACDAPSIVVDRAEDLDWRLPEDAQCSPMRASDNGRFIIDENGDPVFVLGDTAWSLTWKLSRSDVDDYLADRRRRGFNAIGMVSYSPWHIGPNIYGDWPFPVGDDDWEHAEPIETHGSDPRNADAYDYWNHLEYVLARACEHGLYVLLNPTFGEFISGSYSGDDTSRIYFDAGSAYDFGYWIGSRFRRFDHIAWMIGGDRNAVFHDRDERPEYRALAEGIADGVNDDRGYDGEADYSTTVMSYWPRKTMADMKGLNSSDWFHHDPWLDFNSVQDWPWDQLNAIERDWDREPLRPTWLFEGRYEGYAEPWQAWQARYQAWQTVLAGGFGHLFGNQTTYMFGNEWYPQQNDRDVWAASIASEGSLDMRHLKAFMETLTKEQYLSRVPGYDVLYGNQGQVGYLNSTRLVASRGADRDYALVYAADGRRVSVDMTQLAGPSMNAYWFDPRTGEWLARGNRSAQPTTPEHQVVSGPDGRIKVFDPPGPRGHGHDWALLLRIGD